MMLAFFFTKRKPTVLRRHPCVPTLVDNISLGSGLGFANRGTDRLRMSTPRLGRRPLVADETLRTEAWREEKTLSCIYIQFQLHTR